MGEIVLGYEPREWQRRCHEGMSRFSVFALHRRAGKTELAIMRIIDCALKFNLELGLFAYIAPMLKQAKLIAWGRLKQKLEPLQRGGLITISEGELYIRFIHNGAIIRIFGADNPDALRGVRLDGAVVDEVAQMKPELWDEIVRPALSDRRGWCLFIGTPNGQNLFSQLYDLAARGEVDWMCAKYTCYDTDALDRGEIEQMKAHMSPQSFAREMLCDFSAAGDNQLIMLADVIAARERVLFDVDVEDSVRVIGVDPARFGSDRSVIFRRQGLLAYDPIVINGIDNMLLASMVANEIVSWEPDAVFIDAGAGSGVIDRLRQLGHDVIEVAFSGKSSRPDLFANKRMEIWYLMKEWIEGGGVIPHSDSLVNELSTPVYWFDSNGKRVLESKEDIKKRLYSGASPDLADALALTFSLPVVPRSIRKKSKRGGSLDWDPYELVKGDAA